VSAATDAQEALADAQEAAEAVATGSGSIAVAELAARLRAAFDTVPPVLALPLDGVSRLPRDRCLEEVARVL